MPHLFSVHEVALWLYELVKTESVAYRSIQNSHGDADCPKEAPATIFTTKVVINQELLALKIISTLISGEIDE